MAMRIHATRHDQQADGVNRVFPPQAMPDGGNALADNPDIGGCFASFGDDNAALNHSIKFFHGALLMRFTVKESLGPPLGRNREDENNIC
jgi:hypothetical protein